MATPDDAGEHHDLHGGGGGGGGGGGHDDDDGLVSVPTRSSLQTIKKALGMRTASTPANDADNVASVPLVDMQPQQQQPRTLYKSKTMPPGAGPLQDPDDAEGGGMPHAPASDAGGTAALGVAAAAAATTTLAGHRARTEPLPRAPMGAGPSGGINKGKSASRLKIFMSTLRESFVPFPEEEDDTDIDYVPPSAFPTKEADEAAQEERARAAHERTKQRRRRFWIIYWILLAIALTLGLVFGSIAVKAADMSNQNKTPTPAPTTAVPTVPPTCILIVGTSSSNLTVGSLTSSSMCVDVYNSAYAYLSTGLVVNGSAIVPAASIAPNQALIVELYKDAKCLTLYTTFTCYAAPAPTTGPTTGPTTVPTATAGPTTAAPTTPAPTTSKPTTPVPTTSKPTTPVPTTPAPTTAKPTLNPALTQQRGMWVWDMDPCFFNTVAARNYAATCGYANFTSYMDAYFTMVQRPWNGTYPAFTRIFMYMTTTTLAASAAAIRQGLRYAHDRGVAIEFLQDGTAWVKSGAGVTTGVALCQQVAWFNGNATDPRDVFDGVHLDIEPHTLGSMWFSNSAGGTDRYNNAYENNLISIFRGCRAAFKGTNKTVAWDVGDDYYYYASDLWTPLLQDPYVDYLSVMDYYDNLDGVVNGANGIGGINNLLAAVQGRIPVLFGVETSDPSAAPDPVSFWQEGTAKLEAVLANVTATYNGTAATFMGTSIHFSSPYGVLPLNGFGTGTAQITSCNTYGGFLFGMANDTSYISLKLYSVPSNTFLKTYDVTNYRYIPGPWRMGIADATAGGAPPPYRIELYDGAGGTKATAASLVGLATCTAMG